MLLTNKGRRAVLIQNNRRIFTGSEDQKLPSSESGDSIPGQELHAHSGLSFQGTVFPVQDLWLNNVIRRVGGGLVYFTQSL
jgi:hypothetical protein